MNRQTCRMAVARARELRTALREIVELLEAETVKPCRCSPEEKEAGDLCSPCFARQFVNSPQE